MVQVGSRLWRCDVYSYVWQAFISRVCVFPVLGSGYENTSKKDVVPFSTGFAYVRSDHIDTG